MRILLLLFFFLNCNFINATDINIMIIIENCKSCHGEDYSGNKYIKSLKNLGKEKFINSMKQIKSKNDHSVMSRIVKPLSDEDIQIIAEYIYEHN
jgi:cytochrome c553